MKKKLVTLLLSTMLILTACGAESVSTDTSQSEVASQSTTETELNVSENLSELEAIGDIEVDKNLFSVELTIPAEFIGETTQDELNTIATENGYKSITLNSDGSATYIMTKAQHEDFVSATRESLDNTLAQMVGSEDYPNFTNIKANDDYTEFTITTKSIELDFSESFSVLAFYMYGGMYAVFSGNEVDNISVTFINADSGEVISTSNSSDMAE